MVRQLDVNGGEDSLSGQMAAKGLQIREKYGPQIGWNELLRILQDRTCLRYPCEVQFGAGPLLPGEVAHAVPNGQRPEDGYIIFVHPAYANQLPLIPYLVLQQMVVIDYGNAATLEDAELFGSVVLGVSREEYAHALQELSSQIEGQ